MERKSREDILFILFIMIVLVLAIMYFTTSERPVFLENQIKWWKEFRE